MSPRLIPASHALTAVADELNRAGYDRPPPPPPAPPPPAKSPPKTAPKPPPKPPIRIAAKAPTAVPAPAVPPGHLLLNPAEVAMFRRLIDTHPLTRQERY